jgi:diadenosine tetraphosphatase ApaH/serine/threonine PP2A family protein phosphatase
VWEYVLSIEQAEACLGMQADPIGLIGHSHVALFFASPAAPGDDSTRGAQMSDGALLDIGAGRWLINPGSVGQPRDGDPRAAWLELDAGEATALFHRVPYDIDRAAESIVAAGLPNQLAIRLQTGQ